MAAAPCKYARRSRCGLALYHGGSEKQKLDAWGVYARARAESALRAESKLRTCIAECVHAC
eukprot:1800549-Pleurochrysis_carterae.AAC.1